MALALRPRLSPNSMASRYGSQKLVDRTLAEVSGSVALNPTPNPVITPFSLAGFEVDFPFVERFSGLGLRSAVTGRVGFPALKSVITSLAGFGARRPHAPGGRTAIPAA